MSHTYILVAVLSASAVTVLCVCALGQVSLFQTLFIYKLQFVPSFWHLNVDIKDPQVQSDVAHALLTLTKI